MTVLVKIETRDQQDRPLYEGRLAGEFPDRKAAVEAIEQHLSQFNRTGYDSKRGCWWGAARGEPRERTLFFVK
jgi:hypothetical protein